MMNKYTLFAVTISPEMTPQFQALPGRIWFSATLPLNPATYVSPSQKLYFHPKDFLVGQGPIGSVPLVSNGIPGQF